MNEQYVSFETAKLLKEKGFDWECLGFFKYYKSSPHAKPRLEMNISIYPSVRENSVAPCPTQQMACRWLREEKEIDIIPFHERLPHGCYWCRIERNLLTAHQQSPIYSSYEDAVEAALQYCLTKLI